MQAFFGPHDRKLASRVKPAPVVPHPKQDRPCLDGKVNLNASGTSVLGRIHQSLTKHNPNGGTGTSLNPVIGPTRSENNLDLRVFRAELLYEALYFLGKSCSVAGWV